MADSTVKEAIVDPSPTHLQPVKIDTPSTSFASHCTSMPDVECQLPQPTSTPLPLPLPTHYTGDEAEELKTKEHIPTEAEFRTLRRVPGRLPWTAHTIAFVECCERMSFCGTVAVLVNFIQQPLPHGSITGAGFRSQSGALGLGQRAANSIACFDSLWVYLMPLLGGYMADTHWGRYKTVMVACGFAICGHSLLVVASLPGIITKSQGPLIALLIGLVIMGMGTGGFKACIGTMMAEQTTSTHPRIKVLKSGERVIIDNELTVSRAYLYFYLMLNFGAIGGETAMVYSEKYVGFWLAYTLPMIMFSICPLILLVGRKYYVLSPPTGSVLSKAIKLSMLATKGAWGWNLVKTYKNLSNPDIWEKVKPSKIPPNQRPDWMTFDDGWVDEVQRGIKACKVLSWFPILWLGYNQILHNLTSQAATMNTHGIPNDFFSNINPLTLIILIPVFDQFLYPLLRKHNIAFTPLKRITAGFIAAFIGLGWAAVVQSYIYKHHPCGYYANSCARNAALLNEIPPTPPISAWWQSGSYIFTALSELLAVITGMEYCFSKAPQNMKSLVYAVYLFMTAIAAAMGQAFVAISDDPLLIWNYSIVSGLLGMGAILFWLTFRDLDKEDVKMSRGGSIEK